MPTYHCVSPPGVLDAARRQLVADEITRVHAQVAGSAAFFAHVYFTETQPGGYFVGGRALQGDHLAVHGYTRAGRPGEQLTLLVAELVKAVSAATGIAERSVWIYLGELPPGQMAEWGHVVPEIGAEQAWFASMPAEDRAAIDQFVAPVD